MVFHLSRKERIKVVIEMWQLFSAKYAEQINSSTLRAILHKFKETYTLRDLPGSGRPKM